MNDAVLREHLIRLLDSEEAHAGVRKALLGVNPKLRHIRPSPDSHSIWELLEHMRIVQEDILQYTLDPNWTSPGFPKGYWPPETPELTEFRWITSYSGFFEDFDNVLRLVRNLDIDLTAKIPHGEWRTYLREILLVADHNSYETGQIIYIRKLLGDWPPHLIHTETAESSREAERA